MLGRRAWIFLGSEQRKFKAALPVHVLELDDWRLLADWEGNTALYAIEAGPGEQTDQASAEPLALAMLQEALAPYVAQAQDAFPELSPAR